MAAPSTGIKQLLIAAGIGVDVIPGQANQVWPIYISKLPDVPDSCIAIFDNGGLPPDPKWLLDYPDVNILVRAQAYPDVFNKARDVRSALLGLTSQTINGDRWCSVTAIGDIVDAGRDKMDRVIRSLNLRLIMQPAATSFDIRLPL